MIKNMDFAGFTKNELTFSPMKARDRSITNFEGRRIARKTSVLMFVNAAAPLRRKEGVKGKQ